MDRGTTPNLALWMQRCGLPRLDAQMLLSRVLGLSRAQQAAHPEQAIDAGQQTSLDCLAARLRAGEPLAYVLGVREFYGLEFAVTRDVLIPRADTELLVDMALERLDALPEGQSPRVLDLGTGSGAVAIALAHRRPELQVWALDSSAAALNVAQENARRLLDPRRPGGSIRFVRSNWFDALKSMEMEAPRFDCIVSNPPYVAQGDPHLAALRFEPALALTGGNPSADGLGDIRRIVAQSGRFLAPAGWLLLEHGYDQAAAVRSELADKGYSAVQSGLDLAGIERVTGGRPPDAVLEKPETDKTQCQP